MIPRTASNAAWLVPGSRLDRYDLLLPIAEGGMAVLWLARQQGKHGFDKVVAIKTILPKLAAEPGFQKMFLDEARVASRIEHVNVAQVLDLGEENGVLFMAMEWVDSESLINLGRAVARAKNPTIPIGILARVMADACAGLHTAHELKDDEGRSLHVVHRDISPHNLLISFRGITKIIDFGIAKARNRLAHDTNVGTVKGKIAYMAPEQAMGHEVDRRADVWGAGATLYRFLAGRAPYSAANPVATLRLLTSGQPPPPLPTNIPKPIRLVVDKSLELDVERRFRTVDEMRLALEEAMRAAHLQTTQADVEAFMAEHLGETRSSRAREIDQAVRESRSRTRATVRMNPSSEELALGHRSDRPPSATSVPAVSSDAPPPEDEASPVGPIEAPTRAFSHKRIRSVRPNAHETPTTRPPSVPQLPQMAEGPESWRGPAASSGARSAASPKAPADSAPSVAAGQKSTPSQKKAADAAATPEGDDELGVRRTTKMRPKVPTLPDPLPPMRRTLPTPLAMQVAPLSLRTSSPSLKAEADLSRELASKLARPPTPAWIRVQPGLSSRSAFPEDSATPASAPDGSRAPRPEADESFQNANTATASWIPMRVGARSNRISTLKLRVVKGGTGVLALGVVVVALGWMSRSTSVGTPYPPANAAAAASTTLNVGTDSAPALIERARAAKEGGRPGDAKRLLTSAIAQEPANAEALTGLAEIERDEGGVAEAIADYRHAVSASPAYVPARLGLADILWANGQRVEAQSLYRSIVATVAAGGYPDRARERAAD